MSDWQNAGEGTVNSVLTHISVHPIFSVRPPGGSSQEHAKSRRENEISAGRENLAPSADSSAIGVYGFSVQVNHAVK